MLQQSSIVNLLFLSALINSICVVNFWRTQPAVAQINCEDTNNVTEANACLREADQRLNQIYRQLISNLTGEDRRELITAERAWIKYRDANCAFRIRNFPLDTSMGRQFQSVCFARMTRERTRELEDQLQK